MLFSAQTAVQIVFQRDRQYYKETLWRNMKGEVRGGKTGECKSISAKQENLGSQWISWKVNVSGT